MALTQPPTSPPTPLLRGEGSQITCVADRWNGHLCPPLVGEGGRRPGEVPNPPRNPPSDGRATRKNEAFYGQAPTFGDIIRQGAINNHYPT